MELGTPLPIQDSPSRLGAVDPGRRRVLVAAALAGCASMLLLLALVLHSIRPLSWQYGGSGGTPGRAWCPEAHLVTGLRVFRGPTTVAGVTLLCRARGTTKVVEGPTLGQRAAEFETLRCNPGSLGVGIWGSAGTLVDRVSLICAPEATPAGPMQYLPGAGATGGERFLARCDGALRGLRGAAGQLLDRVGLLCGAYDG